MGGFFWTKKKTSNQKDSTKGLFGQYEPDAPPPQKPKRELTWFSDFAPFGIQFRIWFFILVGLVIIGTVFFYRYDPYHDDRDALFTSIGLFNKAIMLTDPQGTGDYFSYWNEDILAIFKEGLIENSQIGSNLFLIDSRLHSLNEPYKNLIGAVVREYSDYILRNELWTTSEEKEYYQELERSTVFFIPTDINQWFIYWNSNKDWLKETFNLEIDEEPFKIK